MIQTMTTTDWAWHNNLQALKLVFHPLDKVGGGLKEKALGLGSLGSLGWGDSSHLLQAGFGCLFLCGVVGGRLAAFLQGDSYSLSAPSDAKTSSSFFTMQRVR